MQFATCSCWYCCKGYNSLNGGYSSIPLKYCTAVAACLVSAVSNPALAVLPVALGVLDTDSVTGWGCIGPFLRCARHDPDLEPTVEAVGVVARELECFPGSL